MSLKEEVENPMWFTKQAEVTEDFTRGYCQAVYQIRMMLSHNNEPSPEVRRYTEFMIEELNSYRKKQAYDSTRESKRTIL